MIILFRRFRQGLLTENKFSKYFIYAIGEIVLVMIGILLALQVSNWNENSKQRAIEQDYLVSLKEEFKFNRLKLEKVVHTNNSNLENALKLSNLMDPETPKISEKEFAALAVNMVNIEAQYRPNQAVIDEIISSGKLGIFRSNKLKFGLSSGNSKLFKVRFQEQELQVIRNQVIAVMNAEGNAKRIVADGQQKIVGIKESKFELGNLQLLQSQALENVLIDFILTSQYLDEGYYAELKKEIDQILVLIEDEIE
jgi:hypothetical protein